MYGLQYLSFLCGVGLALFVWRWDERGHTLSYTLYGMYLYASKKLYRMKNLLEDTLAYDIYSAYNKDAVHYDTYLRAVSGRTDDILKKYVSNMRMALSVYAKKFIYFGIPLMVLFYAYLPYFLLGVLAYGTVRYTKHYIISVKNSEPIATTLILVDCALQMHKDETEEKVAPADTL